MATHLHVSKLDIQGRDRNLGRLLFLRQDLVRAHKGFETRCERERVQVQDKGRKKQEGGS